MSFKMKYPIKQDFIAAGTKRRSGAKIQKHLFGVLHDTGNSGSTAANNVSYFKRTANEQSASAHTFIDDKEIIECIPTDEKAWHVLYNVTTDNNLYGDDANDVAIGVELCFGGAISFAEAYERYVWYCAYISYKFGFPPSKWIGHEKLDPARKTDPTNALRRYGKTYEGLLTDIIKEYEECTKVEVKEVEQMEVKRAELPVSDWAKTEWEKAVQNGYFDGSAPQDYLTREQAAAITNKIVSNIRKFVVSPLEKRIEELEKQVKGAE
jgi:N-acetylmuramoyl-L-alanine amidase